MKRGILILSCVALLMSDGAKGLVCVELPFRRVYATRRKVVVCSVEGVRDGIVELSKGETFRDDGVTAGATRVDFSRVAKPPALNGDVKGAAVVLMLGNSRSGRLGLVHFRDAWWRAENSGDGDGEWSVTGRYYMKGTFPGRTTALVRLVRDMKAGKAEFPDRIDRNYLGGPVEEIGRIPNAAGATLHFLEIDGKSGLELVVGGELGVYRFGGGRETNTTAEVGLGRVTAYCFASGDMDGDGTCDLLADRRLYRNVGGRFELVREFSLLGEPKTALFMDVNCDGAKEVVVVTDGGDVVAFSCTDGKRVPFALPRMAMAGKAAVLCPSDGGKAGLVTVGPHGMTWLSPGQPTNDFERMVGVNLNRYYTRYREGFVRPRVVPLDVNGDGRRDLIGASGKHAFLLVSRGYGCYFFVYNLEGLIRRNTGRDDFNLQGSFCAADLEGDRFHDLVVLTPRGQLLVLHNRPHGRHGRHNDTPPKGDHRSTRDE